MSTRRVRAATPIMACALLAAAVSGFAQDAKPWERQGTKVGQAIVGPDGGRMVWVPAGEFDMGAAGPKQHHVRVSKGFWLGTCPVTNAQYRQYCRATAAAFPPGSDQGDDHPLVFVSWAEAKAYCEHYGLSLPTEAQWEYAARGAEGPKYPWGDQWDETKCCNKGNQGPSGRTFPIGSFPVGASWCGALDLAGNVWQWCQDWYGEKYYGVSPGTDPPGPDGGEDRVVRGGSFYKGESGCRSVHRSHCPPETRYNSFGFRVSRTP